MWISFKTFTMQKVLIVSVSVGNGHTKAAEALKKEIEQSYPNMAAVHVDFLDFIDQISRKVFFDSYQFLINYLPILYQLSYKAADNTIAAKIISKATRLNRQVNSQKFKKFIDELKPWVIIFTHFTPADLFNNLNLSIPSFIIVTDFTAHRLWFAGKEHHYFVANQNTQKLLTEFGLSKTQIEITGIPIDPVFFNPINLTSEKQKLNIDKNQKVVTILPSGSGKIKILTLIKNILKDPSITILAIAGKNKELLKNLQELAIQNDRLKTFAWQKDVSCFIKLADWVISKPGGLTISECLSLGKPLGLLNPIPGQEQANLDYILSLNSAYHITDYNWNSIKESLKNLPPPPTDFHRQASKLILDSILKKISPH
jgi:processive 1,2-diacylglycerol beta-glucosyltransferase